MTVAGSAKESPTSELADFIAPIKESIMTICSRKTGHPNGGCAVSDCSRWTPASEKSCARKTTCTQSSNELHRAIKLESSARFKIFCTRQSLQTPIYTKMRNSLEQKRTSANTVVDAIPPATPDEHRALVREQFGIEDGWPVMTESFRQWVIEDDFVEGRPAWEQVGAQFTSDVLPYEKMKLRLLNASHQAICYVGMLQGYEFAHEAMADQRITKLMRLMMDIEVTPLLPEVPGIDLDEYKNTLIERFANPAIRDQLGRLGTEGSARIPKFVLPSVTEQLQRGGPIKLLSLTVASWFRYLSGKDDTGKPMPMNDPMLDQLRDAANAGGKDPRRLLAMRQLFSEELARNQRFVQHLAHAPASFYDKGTAATLGESVA